jgi:uncharacterized protein involved in type VI secretion and phage assembly
MNRQRMPGVVLGTVKSTPDELGCVEVEYRGIGEHRRPRVPIATPLAGGSRGLYFMPEVDDEVLVAFDHGHPDHPFIVGFLWDGVQKPPETDRQNRVIVTPGGHQLRFEDGTGKVIVESSGGHTVELDDEAGTVKVAAAGGGNEIVIETAGTITIRASTRVTVAAPQIELTEGAAHPVVFGDLLLSHLNNMATVFASHLHVGELALGIFPVTPAPPATPFPSATPSLVSTEVKTG